MAIRIAGGCLLALSIVGLLLTAGCALLPPSGDEQAYAVPYPRSPLGIEPPIHYQGSAMNESDTVVTTLILNLTVTPETMVSGTPEQVPETNIAKMHIRYADDRDLYTLEPGEYSISRLENGDDNTLESSEVVELILPLKRPIPASTNVHVEFWIPYQGTLTLSFRTPAVIESSGQVTEFTAEPFIPQ